jgi:hypothetical protein
MALNPEFLKALAGGAKSSGAFNAEAANAAMSSVASGKAGTWNLGQSIIDILSTGGYASAGITRKVGENISSIQRNDLGGLADLLNPLSVFPAAAKGIEERRTYSKNLKDLGVDDTTSTWLGLALDIGLDPTTYITGGTIAGVKGISGGVRLAKDANKANAVVLKSATEAAAENAPDLARSFIPQVEPLTQGQKLGNFLTGALRGYEFNKSNRAADIANQKLANAIQKDAKKNPANADLAEEALSSLELARKNSKVSIADNLAIQNRELFMKTISESKYLQEKFGRKAAKAAAKVKNAEDLRYTDSAAVAKAAEDAKITEATAKGLESSADTVALLGKGADEIVPAAQPEVASLDEAVAKETEVAKLLDRAEKSLGKDVKLIKSVEEVAKAIVDPAATARRKDKNFRNINEFVEALSLGKVKLTPNQTNKIANTLGVSADPTQTKRDLINKTLTKLVSRVATKASKVEQYKAEAQALRNALESNRANATPEAVAVVTKAADPEDVAPIAEEVMQVEQEIATVIDDAVGATPRGTNYVGPRTAEQLMEAASSLRALPAAELTEDFDFIFKGNRKTGRMNLETLLTEAIPAGPLDQLQRLAKELGITVDDVLFRAADGDTVILNNPAFKLSVDAVRLDMLNTESRIEAFNRAWVSVKRNVGKSQRTLGDSVEEEGRLLRAYDNIFRFMGVPVRFRENLPMQLRRDGKAFIGDKLSDGFVPLEFDVTLADLLLLAVKSGKGDVMGALRFPGNKYQNVMPSNFENAMGTYARYRKLGEPITPGSDAWLEIRKALDEQYIKPASGVKAKAKVSVDELFAPARHLNPGKSPKGVQLKKIPKLDEKLEAAVKLIVDGGDDLMQLHATRAAARLAESEAEILPVASEVISNLISYFGIKERFATRVTELANSGGKLDDAALATLKTGSDGLDAVKANIKGVLQSMGKNKKLFKDPEIAEDVFDMLMNMFLKGLLAKQASPDLAKLGEVDYINMHNYITKFIEDVKSSLRVEIDMMDDIAKAKPKQKIPKEKVVKAKNTRREGVSKEIVKAVTLVPRAVDGQDVELAKDIQKAVDGPDDVSTVKSNNVAGNADKASAGAENVASTAVKTVTSMKLGERFMEAMSGSYGMGQALKVIIGGVEYVNHSRASYFNNSLRALADKYDRNIVEINKAFALLQRHGRTVLDGLEEGAVVQSFDEWLATADTAGVNMDIVADLRPFIDALFGESGALANSITQPYFADELNKMFAMRKFWEIGEEQAFKINLENAADLGPLAVKYSWASAQLDDQFGALGFLSEYTSALHAVQTRIGIGQSFSSFFGRTADMAKAEGIDLKTLQKIDPNDEFGKFLDPDMLYDIEELKRFKFVKKYVTYEKSFRGSTQKIVDFSDRITRFLKASHTTWRVGHHVTSIIGEAAMNTLAGVNSPKYYHNAFNILVKFDPSIYKGDPNLFKGYIEMSSPKGLQMNGDFVGTVGYVSASTGRRTVVTDKAVAYAAERLGILTRGGQSTVEDLELDTLGQFRNDFVGAASRMNSSLAEFSSHRDNIFRMAHFVKELEKGGVYKSFEEAAIAAAQKVAAYHPTIGGLSAFERKYMRRAVFFYTWQRIAATRVFGLMIEKPGAVIVPSKIQYAFAEANGFNPESFGDPWDPDGMYASWNTGSLYGPQFQGPQGAGDAMGFGPAIPQLDILNSLFGGFTLKPGETGLDAFTKGTQNLAGQNLSPLPKWFAELTTGNRVGTGGNIVDPLEYALDQVGGINTISKVTGIGRQPETGLTPDEIKDKAARSIINWFGGQKLQDYTTTQTQKQWSADQAAALRKLFPNQ